MTHAAEIESESNEEAEDNQPNENETSEDDDEAEIDEINEVENSLELSIIEPDEPVTQDQVESVEEVILYTPEMEIYIIPETIKVEPSETQLIPEEEAVQPENLIYEFEFMSEDGEMETYTFDPNALDDATLIGNVAEII